MGDTAFAHNGSDFREDQPKATHGEATELHHMPIIRQTFDRRILAQRRHHDAVWNRHTANRQWRKKQGTHEVSPEKQKLHAA
jgi:hypothetical protein